MKICHLLELTKASIQQTISCCFFLLNKQKNPVTKLYLKKKKKNLCIKNFNKIIQQITFNNHFKFLVAK